nr:PadR family transcriptional regulator [Bordetella genomosp. 13]
MGGPRGGRHGRGGGGFMGGGWGGAGDDGFTRGRKFGADELQLMLLSMLQEQPRHGYELIKALETRSNGFYTPSPGVVYPALTYLEELDYATVEVHGNRKRYHLADAGRAHLDENRERVELLFAALAHAARKMAWMKQAWGGQNDPEETPPGPEAGGWLAELVEARQALKMALFRRSEVDAAEQRRLADILRRATAEIEQGGACRDAKS